MRKILLIVFLFLSGYAMAQPTNYVPYKSKNKWLSGYFDSTFHVPSGATNSLRSGYSGAGALFFNTSDSSLYTYTGYQWRKLGEGGIWLTNDSLIYQSDTLKSTLIGTRKKLSYFTLLAQPADEIRIGDPGYNSTIWFDKDGSFMAGTWNGYTYLNRDSIGNSATGLGINAKPIGQRSFALSNSLARGEQSVAISGGTAIGVSSFAFAGLATGDYSAAITDGAISSGFGSVSLNDGISSALYSTAVNNGHAEGIRSFAANQAYTSGELSSAFGVYMKVLGKSSFGIGLNSERSQPDSITLDSTMAIMGGNVGIQTVSPDSALTVNGGVHFKSGVRLPNLPNGGAAADSVLVTASDGTVKKRNAADFGGGGSGVTTIGTVNGITGSTNGAVISGSTLYMQTYSSENPGLVPAGFDYVDSVYRVAGKDSLFTRYKSGALLRQKDSIGGGGGSLTKGTTTISSNADRRILYDSSGILQSNQYLTFNSSNQLVLRGGSPGASTPSIAASGATSTGIELHDATNGVSMNVNGVREVAFTQSEIRGDNGTVFAWASTTGGAYSGGRNVGLTYGADKTVKVVDASTNLGNINLGGLQTNYAAKTTTYTISATDYTVTGDATSGAFTITLPTAASVAGKIYVIKKIDSSGNAVTVGTTSSQTIDGSTTYSLATQYKYVTVQSNGTNWFIIGNN